MSAKRGLGDVADDVRAALHGAGFDVISDEYCPAHLVMIRSKARELLVLDTKRQRLFTSQLPELGLDALRAELAKL